MWAKYLFLACLFFVACRIGTLRLKLTALFWEASLSLFSKRVWVSAPCKSHESMQIQKVLLSSRDTWFSQTGTEEDGKLAFNLNSGPLPKPAKGNARTPLECLKCALTDVGARKGSCVLGYIQQGAQSTARALCLMKALKGRGYCGFEHAAEGSPYSCVFNNCHDHVDQWVKGHSSFLNHLDVGTYKWTLKYGTQGAAVSVLALGAGLFGMLNRPFSKGENGGIRRHGDNGGKSSKVLSVVSESSVEADWKYQVQWQNGRTTTCTFWDLSRY